MNGLWRLLPDYNLAVPMIGVSLLGACAGAVGTFAVLRRRALTGDALAHAALPGLCAAALVMGGRDLTGMLLGALLTGLAGVGVIAFLRRSTRVKEDAAIGIVLSVFYGAGVVLVAYIQGRPDLPGDLRRGIESYILGGAATLSAGDVRLIAGASVACVMAVLALYKEFELVGFDADFAAAQGWPSGRLDWAMMGLIALTVVVGLPAVGVVMMASLLILPGVTARFWTDRLPTALALAAGFGCVTGAAGAALSAVGPGLKAGPTITLVGTALFAASATLAPRRGLIARSLSRRRFRRELEYRTLLRSLYERGGVGRPAGFSPRLLGRAAAAGHLAPGGDRLTPEGERAALPAVRAYRFWERFLTEYGDLNHLADPLADVPADDGVPAELRDRVIGLLKAEGRWPGWERRPHDK